MTQQIIYRSQPAVEVTALVLTALLDQARAFNAHRGVTGLLVSTDSGFVQALEGDAAVIENLMTRIKRDFRHRNVEILLSRRVEAREFGDWSMAFAGDAWQCNDEGEAAEVDSLRARLAKAVAEADAGFSAETGGRQERHSGMAHQ